MAPLVSINAELTINDVNRDNSWHNITIEPQFTNKPNYSFSPDLLIASAATLVIAFAPTQALALAEM